MRAMSKWSLNLDFFFYAFLWELDRCRPLALRCWKVGMGDYMQSFQDWRAIDLQLGTWHHCFQSRPLKNRGHIFILVLSVSVVGRPFLPACPVTWKFFAWQHWVPEKTAEHWKDALFMIFICDSENILRHSAIGRD